MSRPSPEPDRRPMNHAVPGEPAQLGGSSWQSLVRGTGTIETDFLNGEITLIARRPGWPAPINTRLTALARRAARDGLAPGSMDVDQLRVQVSTPDGRTGSSGSWNHAMKGSQR